MFGQNIRKGRCGLCGGCRETECGTCRFCLDMRKRGGSGTLRRACVRRRCDNMSAGPRGAALPRGGPARGVPANPTRGSAFTRGSRPGQEHQGGGVAGQNSVERHIAEAIAAAARKGGKPTWTFGGAVFDVDDLFELVGAISREPSIDIDGTIDWARVSRGLGVRLSNRRALLEFRRAGTRREDESRGALRLHPASRRFARGPKGPVRPEVAHADAQRAADADRAAATLEARLRAPTVDAKWTPRRCHALWRFVAYNHEEGQHPFVDGEDTDDEAHPPMTDAHDGTYRAGFKVCACGRPICPAPPAAPAL